MGPYNDFSYLWMIFYTVIGHLLAERHDMLHLIWEQTPFQKYRGTKNGCTLDD